MKTKNQMKQPFFARFLEGQMNEKNTKNQNNQQQPSSKFFGDDIFTLKFPSDSDEGI